MTKKNCKKFIIENIDKFVYYGKDGMYIMKLKNSYYTEISINLLERDQRFYSVCCWGDRKSWMWFFRKDFLFAANIIRKSKDTKIDTQIINLLKFKNESYQ